MYIDPRSLEVSPSWANLLRKRHPNTGFPNKMSDELISQMGIHPVKPALKKANTDYAERAPRKIQGLWFQVLEEI